MDKPLSFSRYQIPDQIAGNPGDVLQVLATPEFGYRWEGFRFASSLRATPHDYGEFSFTGLASLAIQAFCITRTSVTQQVICCHEKEDPVLDLFDWRFYIDTDDRLKFDNGTIILSSWFPVVDGLGHQFAVLHEGGELKLMVDGLVVDSAASQTIISTDGPFFFIGNRHGGGYAFKGVIESLELWTTTGGGSVPTSTDLVADLFLDTTLTIEPQEPVNGTIDVSPVIDNQLRFLLHDEANNISTSSVNINFLTPGYEEQAVINGVAQPGFTVDFAVAAGLGYNVTLDWDINSYFHPWNKEVWVQVVAENDQPSLVTYLYSFYTASDTTAPTLKSFVPAENEMRVTTGSGVYFEVEDLVAGVNLSTLVIEIDVGGTGNWDSVYTGGVFQGFFTGTVVEATPGDPRLVEVTIDPPGFPVNSTVYLRVTVSDYGENEVIYRYWIRTIDVAEAIVPVYPAAEERLVSTGESLAIAFELEDPLTVTVGGTLAYDDGLVPKFRNGWLGSYLDDAAGKRLILEPPASFTIYSNVSVVVTTASHSKSYFFRVATEQVTTTGDVESPRISEAAASNIWVGYTRGGNLVLRRGDPLTPEVTVIPASQWDHGYDPTLGKYLLYWTDNGKVFYSTADPTDTPISLPQPSVVNSLAVEAFAGEDSIIRLKKFDQISMPQPVFKTRPPTATLAIYKPTSDPNASRLIGFNLYSLWHTTENLLHFIPVQPGDPFDWDMPSSYWYESALYFLRAVYDRAGQLFEGYASPTFSIPEYAEPAAVVFGGGDFLARLVSNTFPPLKFFAPETASEGMAGGDFVINFEVVGYETIKIIDELTPDTATEGFAGGDNLPLMLVGGFGIIGVG